MQDNFEEAYQQVYSAFIKLCGGYYEPKSQRDLEGSMLLEETIERLRMIKADNAPVKA